MAFLELRGITKAFEGHAVLDGLDLDIERGEVITIIGESGSGKSLLLKLVLGLIPLDAGTVRFDGEVISGLPEDEMVEVRQRMGMLFQEGALFDSSSVYDNVAYGLVEQRKLTAEQMIERVADSLTSVGLEGIEKMWPADLSGGMQKRVALARAIAVHPEVVFYDEPTEGLDPINVTRVERLILGLRRSLDITTVVVTHNLKSAFETSDRIAMIHGGKIVANAAPERIRESTDGRVRGFVGGVLLRFPWEETRSEGGPEGERERP